MRQFFSHLVPELNNIDYLKFLKIFCSEIARQGDEKTLYDLFVQKYPVFNRNMDEEFPKFIQLVNEGKYSQCFSVLKSICGEENLIIFNLAIEGKVDECRSLVDSTSDPNDSTHAPIASKRKSDECRRKHAKINIVFPPPENEEFYKPIFDFVRKTKNGDIFNLVDKNGVYMKDILKL